MGQKVTFYSLDIIFNIPIELKKKKNFQKGKVCNNKNFCMEWKEETRAIRFNKCILSTSILKETQPNTMCGPCLHSDLNKKDSF